MIGFLIFAVIVVLALVFFMVHDARKLEKELDELESRHSKEKENQI
jgi:hypothetical protein